MSSRVPQTRPRTLQRRAFIFSAAGISLILGIIWLSATKLHSAANTGTVMGKPGTWGQLESVRINIELPDQFINVDEIEGTDWIFQGLTQAQVIEFLRDCGVEGKQLDGLSQTATWKTDQSGCHVAPDDAFIFSLSPESRGKIYARLAASDENINQFYAFTYRPDQLPELLQFSGLHEETVRMFKSLLYPQGSLVRFADVDTVLRKLTDKHERLRLVKTVTRRSTLLVKLNVMPDSNIDTLVDYWGTGGHAKDLRPLLESLARVPGGCKIDIAHLLPPFARKRIYTYPNPEEESDSGQQDCHWTTLNFFTDNRFQNFSDPQKVERCIERDYVEVKEGVTQARFGDAVFLKTSNNILIHSATYIADDIMFTKNGGGSNQPWIYMKLDDMLACYSMPNETLRAVVYRRKQI